MKLIKFETFIRDRYCLVRLTREDGTSGWGQMAINDPDICAGLGHRHLAPIVLGAQLSDLSDIVELVVNCECGRYKFRGTHLMRAIAGIDTAAHDLLARARGIPVCTLLGADPVSLPIYASSMFRHTKPQDEVDMFKSFCDETGTRALKMKIGKRLGRPESEDNGRTEALLPLAADQLSELTLKVDANGSYNSEQAIEVGTVLESCGYEHYEEPCAFWDIESTQAVADALEIAVAGGEQDHCDMQLQRMIKSKTVDIIQPDLGYLGGIQRSLRVAETAAQHAMKCTPHNSGPTLLFPMTMHLVAAMPNRGAFLERSISCANFDIGMYNEVPIVKDGAVQITDAPGWGVEIRDDWLAQCAHQISE